MEKTKIPANALNLGLEGPSAACQFAQDDSDKKNPRLNMTIYSGGIIKNHWYWDDLVLDLEGAQFLKRKYPILENHLRDKKIAFMSGKPIVDKNVRVDPDKVVFVSTPESEEFQTLSSEGFPYESSARVVPKAIQRVAEGEFAEVNGIKLKGPGTVFRKWEFVEGSVCVFGYDRNTNSEIFSKTDETVEIDCELSGDLPGGETKSKNEEDVKTMDLKTLKAEHPDLVQEIQDEAVTQAEAKFLKEKETLEETAKSLETSLAKETEARGKLEDKVLKLEKNETIREEQAKQERAARAADKIWDTELSESSIPDRLYGKVRQHVKFEKHLDDDGHLDKEAFAKAVKAELEDWAALNVDKKVLGNTHLGKEVEDESLAKEDADDEALADELLSFDEIGGETGE